jgi:hypothetical protein
MHYGILIPPSFVFCAVYNIKHGLLPRDLRKLEVGPQATAPSILVRKNSILLSLLHIRALVKADKVLVFDVMSGGDSHAQSIFMWDLEAKLRQGSKAMGGLPYELRYCLRYPKNVPLILARWKVY